MLPTGTIPPPTAYYSPSALLRRPIAMQSFSDTLGQVFRAILANKLRTFLTMFGIAWVSALCSSSSASVKASAAASIATSPASATTS